MYYINTYAKSGIVQKNQISQTDIQSGDNIWIDLENPTAAEISQIQEIFLIDANILNQYVNGVKKPQIRVLQKYIFTLLLSIRFKTLQAIETEAIYMFIGKNWLITIHSSTINLKQMTRQIFENDKGVIESSINILYYNIVTKFVDEYEQVLTAIEIAMTDLEEKSMYRPSKIY
jgi:magnesium transporter